MTFSVRFSPNSERDFLRAQAYYDNVAPHQTDRFIEATLAAARLLADRPEIGRMIQGEVRRWHLEVFPYQLWYRIDADVSIVRIIAVVGDSQDHVAAADSLR